MSSIQKTESLNCLVGVDIELLKTNIGGVFQKTDDGFKLLVAPTETEATTGVTFGELKDELSKAFGGGDDAEKIASSLGELSASSGESGVFDVNKLRFELRQTYLYVENTKGGNGTAASTNAEYALAIYVDFSDALKSLGFFKLNSVFLSVWNTKRQNVLDRMNMGEFDKLLA